MCMNKTTIAALAFVPFLCVAKNEELTEFDFCGIPDSRCSVSNLGAHVGRAELPLEFQEVLTKAAQQDGLGLTLVFQGYLSSAEMWACLGDVESYRSTMDAVGDLLRFLLKNEHVVGRSMFDCNLARTEISLARVVNEKYGRRIVVSADDIRRWLPEFEDEGSRKRGDLKRFRTLLAIGTAIEQYRSAHDRLPDNLRVLVDEKNLGIAEADLFSGNVRVEYRNELGFWKLRLGRNVRRNPEPMFDFVPAVFNVAGVIVDEVWFASSYTQKRRELFVNGYLQSEDPSCRCRLKGSIVIRGDVKLSSEN